MGTYSQAVTHHIYSQRVNEEFSANVCALTLGGSPRSLVFKKMKFDAQAQRISWVIYFDYIGTPPTAVAYAPAHHRAMLERIYGEIHAPVEFREPEPVPADEMGEVAVSVNPGWQSAVIRVLRVGTDTPAEIRRARRDLCRINGAEAVYLELPLSQPGTPELCRIAEEAGFFFCGLGPSFAPDGDTLRMQYLNVPLDTSLVKLASPFAQELLGYIDQERARVAAG